MPAVGVATGTQAVSRHEERYIGDLPWSLQPSRAKRSRLSCEEFHNAVTYCDASRTTRRVTGGLFDWLTSRDTNKTLRAMDHDRNRTEIEMRKDWYRAQLELERERRAFASEILPRLGEGGEYRDSTLGGWREMRKAPVPPNTLVALSDNCANEGQTTSKRIELDAEQAPPRDLPIAPEQPPPDELGCIDSP